MADIYIPESAFANPPNKKMAREVKAAFPQIEGFTRHEGPFVFNGATVAAGAIVHTSNPDPDPDEAAIVAFLTTHDGSQDPLPFGVPVPVVANAAALPAQPPDLPTTQAMMAIVQNPSPAVYFYAFGAWRGPVNIL